MPKTFKVQPHLHTIYSDVRLDRRNLGKAMTEKASSNRIDLFAVRIVIELTNTLLNVTFMFRILNYFKSIIFNQVIYRNIYFLFKRSKIIPQIVK